MLSFVLRKYKSSKGLVNYFFLTYLDKIISFALPLSILFIIKDKSLYSFVELAFSYATLAMIIAELGVSNYLFFGYKEAGDKELFLKNALLNFKFLLLIYLVLAIPVFISVKMLDADLLLLFVLTVVRTLFTLYMNFFSNIYRLKDNPSGIYLTSIVINIASFLLLMFANLNEWPYKIVYFFLPSFLLIVLFSIRFLVLEYSLFVFKEFMAFLKKSLQFSWPIIINVLAMSYINNYAKIYAYGHLTQDQMVQISYVMRIGLIVQLTHSSFASYFSKSIFMDTSQKLNYKIFRQYSAILFVAVILLFLIIVFTNALFGDQINIPLTASTFLFISYILLWCYIGYLEIYFGIKNANRKILYYSIFSSVVYTILLKTGGEISIFQLALFMVISALLNLVLVIKGLHTLQVINLKTLSQKSKPDLNE